MLKKGSKLYSILTGTCPKCQCESMYVNSNPFVISETMKMHDHCRTCGLKYKIEPNFFFGAMYVSYALAVACGVAIFIISFFFLKIGILNSFIAILVGLLFLMPWVARVARNIYINMFVKYDPSAASEQRND